MKSQSKKSGSRSKVLKKGYINIYSKLSDKELRQVHYKSLYKKVNPQWDESMVYLSKKFAEIASSAAKIKVFDAGCGHGNYVIDENRDLIDFAAGVDVSEEFVEKNISLDQIKIGNLEEIPYSNESFDIAVSLWVLEHLENPQKVFKEIGRVLRKDGYFLFVAPNKNFLPLKVMQSLKNSEFNHTLNKVLFGRKEKDIFPAFYRASTVKDIAKLAETNSFKVEELFLNYDPSYTSFNGLSFKVSNRLSGLNFMKAHVVGVLRKV